MIIALRRGTDWVATGIYNATDTRPDGSPRFNPASDYVVKYTLKNITGDTATYKNPVRIAAGMTSPNYYGNGQVSSSGKTTPVYCVQHDDGTVYVLDGYDPWAKMYWLDVPTQRLGRNYSRLPLYKSKNNGKTIHRFAYNTFLKNWYSWDFMLQPVGYTSEMTFSNQVLNGRTDYYPDPATGAPTPFTYYYMDPNGTPIEFGGQRVFKNVSYNDIFGFGITDRFHGRKLNVESAGYHQLFFQNEKATFINAALGGADMDIYATAVPVPRNGNSIASCMFFSSTTLEASYFEYRSTYNEKETNRNDPNFKRYLVNNSLDGLVSAPRSIVQFLSKQRSAMYQFSSDEAGSNYSDVENFGIALIPATDGMYVDASGKRYDFIKGSPMLVNIEMCCFDGWTLSQLDLSRTAFWEQWNGSTITSCPTPSMTQITIPSITPSDTTISFANVPAPTYSTTNTLYKNVDYIITGLYAPGQFLNDIVVKCKINGQIGKYQVYSANGSLSVFFIRYTDPSTGEIINYRLDNFDPYERYYSAVSAEVSSLDQVQQDNQDGYGENATTYLTLLVQNNNNDLRYFRNQFLANTVAPLFRPIGYQKVIGNMIILPVVWNDETRLDMPDVNRYRYQYTYQNITNEYSVVAFSTDANAQVPIEHSGELYFLDPKELSQSRIRLQDMSYHRFFYEGETAGFYNRMGKIPGDNGSHRFKVDDFHTLPVDWYNVQTPRTRNNSVTGAFAAYSNLVTGVPGFHSWRYQGGDKVEQGYTSFSIPSTWYRNIATGNQNCRTILLQCSLSLHRIRPVSRIDGSDPFLPATLPNANFIAYSPGSDNIVMQDTFLIVSPCGLYTDSRGNRYDYIKLVNNAGYYVPVESLTNQIPLAQITTATGGLITGKILSQIPALDVLSSVLQQAIQLETQVNTLQAQLAAAQQAKVQALAAQQAASDAVLAARISQDTAIINSTQAALDSANTNLTQANTNIETLESSLQSAQNSLAQLQSQNTAMQSQVNNLQLQLTAAQAAQTQALAAQQAASDALAAEIAQNTALLNSKQTELNAANASLAQSNNNIQGLQNSLQTAQNSLANLESENTALQGQLNDLGSQLTTSQAAQAQAQTAQQAANDALAAQAAQNAVALNAKQADLDAANANLAQSNTNIQNLQNSLQTAQDALAALQALQDQVAELQAQLNTAQTTQAQAVAAQQAASDALAAAQAAQGGN